MRRLLSILLLAATFSTFAATGRVVKVLPHFLDLKGRHSLSPSLYDRDAYQLQLRQHPEQRAALRLDVLWRVRGATRGKLKLRAELRGEATGQLPKETTLEAELSSRGVSSKCSALILEGEAYQNFGEATAWRVTLRDGAQLIGE